MIHAAAILRAPTVYDPMLHPSETFPSLSSIILPNIGTIPFCFSSSVLNSAMTYAIQPVTYQDALGLADAMMRAMYEDEHYSILLRGVCLQVIS